MITGNGGLDEFIDLVRKLPDDGQCIVKWRLSEYDEKLLSLDKKNISYILEGSRITPDRCRVMSGGENLENSVYRKGVDKHGNSKTYLQTKLLNSVLQNGGATIAFDSINEFPNYSKILCNTIRSNFNARSNANLYYSNTSVSGFGGHRDDHDFVAVQIEGAKDWNIEDACGIRKEIAEAQPQFLSRCVTKPGDLLYVPKGFWHNPKCCSNTSIHVTCSIVLPKIEDFTYWAKKYDSENKWQIQDIDPDSDEYLEVKNKFGEYWDELVENDTKPSLVL